MQSICGFFNLFPFHISTKLIEKRLLATGMHRLFTQQFQYRSSSVQVWISFFNSYSPTLQPRLVFLRLFFSELFFCHRHSHLSIRSTYCISWWVFSPLGSPVSLQTAGERRVERASGRGKQDSDAWKTKRCRVSTFWGNKHFNSTPTKEHTAHRAAKQSRRMLCCSFCSASHWASAFLFTSEAQIPNRITGFTHLSPFSCTIFWFVSTAGVWLGR